MQRIMQIIIFSLLPGVVFALLVAKDSKDKKSKNYYSVHIFDVYAPTIYPIALIGCSVVLSLIMSILGLFLHSRNIEFDIEIIYLCIALTVGCFVLCIIMMLRKISVRGDEITYRTFWGYKKTTSFGSVTEMKRKINNSHIIYVDGRRFGTLEGFFVGADNFLKCCERRHIAITSTGKGTLTKRKLFFNALKPVTAMGFLIACIELAITLLAGEKEIIAQEWFMVYIGMPFTCVFIMPAMGIPLVTKGILHIFRQEKALGFKFSEEMKKRGISDSNIQSDEWFIHTHRAIIIAFRAGYIQEMGEIKACYNRGINKDCQAQITSVTGAKTIVRASGGCLEELDIWAMKHKSRKGD